MRPVRTVAVIGTGVIGASWTAHFLAQGLDVVATDPAAGAESRLRADVASHWDAVSRTGLAAGAAPDRVTFVSSAAEAAARADLVQENGPERIDLKHALIAELDEAAEPDVVIASSSSGLLPSDVQAGALRHPERVLIGHPFNPPHVIPLVEVVPGRQTSEEAVAAAMAFYTAMRKKPVRVRAELPGHIANRMQAALWREAYWLVGSGAATVADIDTAISEGPGLRWAILGPFANQHLSGGPGGIAHILEHLGPPTAKWWESMHTPELTPELSAAIVAGMDDELAGVDTDRLVAARDELLHDLITAKARNTDLPGGEPA